MKRFTETTKWDDPWFMDLPVKYKLFWLYICDRCDNAGAWEPNMRLVAAQIGEPLELAEVLRVFAGRIKQLEGGKLWIEKFIPFQYGNLSPNCRAHIPILNNIEKLRVSKGYPKGIHTLVVKDMEKETEKEKGSVRGFRQEIEDIYSAYPLKKGKPDAIRAIKRAIGRGTSAMVLLERTKAFAKVRGGDVEFCPNPSTWFNQERFNDDPSTWTRQATARPQIKAKERAPIYDQLPEKREATEAEYAEMRRIAAEEKAKLRTELNR